MCSLIVLCDGCDSWCGIFFVVCRMNMYGFGVIDLICWYWWLLIIVKLVSFDRLCISSDRCCFLLRL